MKIPIYSTPEYYKILDKIVEVLQEKREEIIGTGYGIVARAILSALDKPEAIKQFPISACCNASVKKYVSPTGGDEYFYICEVCNHACKLADLDKPEEKKEFCSCKRDPRMFGEFIVEEGRSICINCRKPIPSCTFIPLPPQQKEIEELGDPDSVGWFDAIKKINELIRRGRAGR